MTHYLDEVIDLDEGYGLTHREAIAVIVWEFIDARLKAGDFPRLTGAVPEGELAADDDEPANPSPPSQPEPAAIRRRKARPGAGETSPPAAAGA